MLTGERRVLTADAPEKALAFRHQSRAIPPGPVAAILADQDCYCKACALFVLAGRHEPACAQASSYRSCVRGGSARCRLVIMMDDSFDNPCAGPVRRDHVRAAQKRLVGKLK